MADAVPNTLPAEKMDVDTFLAWIQTQPDGHFELYGGQVVAMAAERATHARAKFELAIALRNAIRASNLPCETFIDSLGIRTGTDTFYEPDVFVRCGERLPGDVIETDDPVIIVEVNSPSTSNIDTGMKLADYLRLSSLRHYLVVDAIQRRAVHHMRDEAGNVATQILAGGALRLDPPGLDLNLDEVFDAIG